MSPARLEIAECLTNSRLHLIVLPTEACNFRCVYCYESFRLKHMDPGVVGGLKRLIERRAPDLERLDLSWFGGEPLLALDVIEDVMDHANQVRALHPDLQVAADITTNGYLLSAATASRLFDRGVHRLQISLDGPREWHDRTRVRPGGRGTFDRIWDNLRELKRSPERFQITLRLHVDQDNVAVMPDFLRQVAEEFSDDRRFDVFLRAIARLGGPRDASLPVLTDGEAATILGRLRADAASLGLALASANTSDSICYAARANSFVVRADGRLNKCTVALDQPSNDVGRLEPDGTVRLRTDRMLPWMRGLASGEAEKLSCPLQGITSWKPSARSGTARTVSLSLAPAAAST
ncbi:MAG: radical SAM protein [Bacteroidota bacterium]